MLKKTIKYEDFDGNKREEDFYFNLTKAEITEMELSESGGFAELIQKVVKIQDQPTLVKIFKDFILKAYGEKSADGKHFRKSPEISADFAATNAYSELFMELATNADAATEFVNGLAPVDEKITAEQARAFLESKAR